MNNKWFKNIPKQGLLCRFQSSDIVVNIVSSKQNTFNSLQFICKDQDNCFWGHEQLIPLTAEEWWQFAPWQTMNSAPMNNEDILLLCSHGYVTGSYRHGAWRSDDNSILEPSKWLPLPRVDK